MSWRNYGGYGGYSSDEDQRYDSRHYSYQQRTVKQVERWPCNRCGKDYASKANLQRHIDSEHAPKPKAIQPARGGQMGGQMVQWQQQSGFTCRYCGNEYANQGNLNRHVTSAHVKNGGATVASSSKHTTMNVVYNVYNQNFYNCKKY